MNIKGTIEVGYKINNIPTYKKTERAWEDGSFRYNLKIEGTKIGELKITKEDVAIDELENTVKIIDQKCNIWFFIYKFKLWACFQSFIEPDKIYFETPAKNNRRFTIFRKNISNIINDIKCEINGDTSIVACVHIDAHLSGIGPLPIELPDLNINLSKVDNRLNHHLINYMQTKELGFLSGDYHDDMLKRWFLILDEIETDRGNAEFARIRNVRNFVSHYFCDKEEVKKLIKKELPNAICTEKEKEVARFDRQIHEHINFVQKYERLTEKRVRDILEQKLDTHCS